MTRRATGTHERTTFGDEEVAAFVPHPLPPSNPALDLDEALIEKNRLAETALARLDLGGKLVPSLDWFLYAFVRKEAVLSSQIEGTQATLTDLLNYEIEDNAEGSSPGADVLEVCNYLDALALARKELSKPDGLPISMRLLNQIHRRLMHGTRGADKRPGEVRQSQNWIGGTRPGNAAYLPPPPSSLARLLSDLERYVHQSDSLPSLVRAGLIHAQFETIHPYLDGNGRIGRLLVALLFEHWRLLEIPLLYLSLFLKRHRAEYYRRLTAIRVDGDWEGWLDFFLEGVTTVADEAVSSAKDLFQIVEEDRVRLLAESKVSVAAIRTFEILPRHPIVSVAFLMRQLDTTRPTAGRAVAALVEAGILVERTGRKRDRSWAYEGYLDRLRYE